MTLRASDPGSPLVLSRNAADATEHAQKALGEGRSRRRACCSRSHQQAAGCLVAARDLQWGRGEGGSAAVTKFLLLNDIAAGRLWASAQKQPVRAKVATPPKKRKLKPDVAVSTVSDKRLRLL